MAKTSGSANETSISSHDAHATNPSSINITVGIQTARYVWDPELLQQVTTSCNTGKQPASRDPAAHLQPDPSFSELEIAVLWSN
ncbi:hypothetical protein E8E15_002111 [Penicillium rubens]|nr:hypothetical protein E8E15_002111 [Penicillium rubens]